MIMKQTLVFLFLLVRCFSINAQTMNESELLKMMNRATSLMQNSKHKEALDAFLMIGKNTEAQRNESERKLYVRSQIDACQCYYITKEYDKGYLLAKKILSAKITSDEKSEIAHIFVKNGLKYAYKFISYGSNKLLEEARCMLEEILSYADERTEKDVKGIISYSWYYQGANYIEYGQYDEAMPCMRNAEAGYKQLGNTSNVITVISHIASIYYFTNEFESALAEYRNAKLLAEDIGKYEKVMSILLEEKKINDKLGNTEVSNVLLQTIDSLANALPLPSISFLYNSYKGDEARANNALELSELWYKKNDTYVAKYVDDRFNHYVDLRDLYTQMKRFDEALYYARLCLEDIQSHWNSSEAEYYMAYTSIANIYKQMGDKKKCEDILDTISIAERFIVEPRECVRVYFTRAQCYQAFGEYEKALAEYKTLDSILSSKYPETDGERISLLPLMGGLEHRLEHYEKSQQLYGLYAIRLKEKYGEDNDQYINALLWLANAEAFAGQIDTACKHYTQTVKMSKQKLKKRLPYLTLAERDGYWQNNNSMFANMTPFAIEAGHNQTDFTTTCYDALVLSKAFLLESDRSTFNIVKKNGDNSALDDFTKMFSLQLKLRNWERNSKLYADSITAINAKINILSRELSNKCRGIGDITSFMDIGYQEIKSALNKNSVLIDFTDFVSKTEGRKYAAFVVSNKQTNPLLMSLFTESSIDSLQIPSPNYYYEEPYATTIRKLIWEPLSAYVKKGSTVYYVPSHLLFQISLESIPMEDGTLLGEHYKFVRLSSARELLRYNPNLNFAKKETKAVLYGGLMYSVETDKMEATAHKYNVPPMFALRGEMKRGDSIYIELPGTEKEVTAVSNILKKSGIEVDPRIGIEGTAESFVSMDGNAPDYLLMATHGFYYSPQEAENYEYLKGYKDAMSLSGLVLSGGNAAWLGMPIPKGVMGGILTAADIATLDFSGMEIVVLSACKTGQGKATPEGLYGLQRAFKKAGVKTIVMTLWSVDDDVTRDFMTKFHELLAKRKNKWNKRKAFEQAKAYIRENRPEAFYWAAFVMLD